MDAPSDAGVAPASEPDTDNEPYRDRPGFRPDVQGLRALAVILVVVYHSGFGLSGGYLGVDVFFVISGFVISRLLLHEQSTSGRISLGRFYARRIRRLVPALAAVLVFVAIVSVLGISPLGSLRSTVAHVGIGAAVYLANFAILVFQHNGYFALPAQSNPLLHTWTLGVEEQFYVFFPLLLIVLAFLWRRFGRRHRVGILVGGVAVAMALSFFADGLLSGSFGNHGALTPEHSRFAFYASPTRAWEFLAGVLIALAEPACRRLNPWIARVLAALGTAAIVYSGWTMTGKGTSAAVLAAVPVAGAAAVIVGGVSDAGGLTWLLSRKPVVWIGDRSYGWYLWHWPFIVLYRASFPTASTGEVLIVAIVALVPTELSYRYLEQPFRRNPKWLSRRAVGLAACCAGLAIVFLIGLDLFPTIKTPGVKRAAAASTHPDKAPATCVNTYYKGDPKYVSHCTWPLKKPKGQIVLIGDSHTWALQWAMGAAANNAGYQFHAVFRPGCPFVDMIREYATASLTAYCREFYTDSMQRLILTHPSLVILASRWSGYVREDYTLRDPVTGVTSGETGPKQRVWQDGLTRTLRTLAEHEIPSVVVATVPQLIPFNVGHCPSWRLWFAPSTCNRTLSRRTVAVHRHPAFVGTRRAVAQVPMAHLVDFTDQLCSPTKCSTSRGDVRTYLDSSHLSGFGASRLVPTISARVIPWARPTAGSKAG